MSRVLLIGGKLPTPGDERQVIGMTLTRSGGDRIGHAGKTLPAYASPCYRLRQGKGVVMVHNKVDIGVVVVLQDGGKC